MARSRVFMDIAMGADPAGRLTIELFTDKTPKTCENFRQLCTNTNPGRSYAMTPFHRIIDEFMIQGGDITAGNGTGGISIYNDGGEFEDENLDWRDMDAPGLVCMANRGKDTNSSQFFITLEPCPHLNGKHTIFGHIVGGQEVLQKMASVKVDDNDKPLDPVLIAKCGELERKKKAMTTKTVSPGRTSHRGRQRDESASPPRLTEPKHHLDMNEKRKRRQSDNHIDETLRGRPRARSNSASDASNAVQSDRDSRSPAPIHGRQRSPSPSRVPANTGDAVRDGDDSDAYGRRRRRSLPNQYREASNHRSRHSERQDKHGHGRRSRSRDGTRDEKRGGRRDWDDPRARRDDRMDGRRDGGYAKRQQDRYRPRRDGRLDDGRLGGDGRLDNGAGGDAEGGIKFKGRGSMKYREPDRRW